MNYQALSEHTDHLSEEARSVNRAIISLMEQLYAINWYNTHIESCTNDELSHILDYNRRSAKAHVAKLIEWLRRHDGDFDRELKSYLFSDRTLPFFSDIPESDSQSGPVLHTVEKP